MDSYCDTIVAVAEVIKLTDPSLLYLEVSTLVSKYPDIRYQQSLPWSRWGGGGSQVLGGSPHGGGNVAALGFYEDPEACRWRRGQSMRQSPL